MIAAERPLICTTDLDNVTSVHPCIHRAAGWLPLSQLVSDVYLHEKGEAVRPFPRRSFVSSAWEGLPTSGLPWLPLWSHAHVGAAASLERCVSSR